MTDVVALKPSAPYDAALPLPEPTTLSPHRPPLPQ